MEFSVGSTVIHAKHGIGEVIEISDVWINGRLTTCYVVKVRDLTTWVPVSHEEGRSSLRLPTPKTEFDKLFDILRSPNEPLPEDRKERKTQLLLLINDGQAASLCRLVRDLTGLNQKKKLSEDDQAIFARAQNSLLTEWAFSLSVALPQASKQMNELIHGD
jgi:RNA polymerase-interacting CarD/CdnL/TRCF family regulator